MNPSATALLAPLCVYASVSGCALVDPAATATHSRHADAELILPTGTSLSSPLTEKQAVWIALLNNPSFKEATAELGFATAELIQAKTLPNPTLSMLFPAGPKQLEFAVKYPLEAIWLRPKRLGIAHLDAEKTASTLQQSSLDLIRDVRIAYAGLAQAKQRVALASEALQLSEKVTGLVAAQHRAGTALELEATTAKTDELQARQELARLRDDVQLASLRLTQLLGVGTATVQISGESTTSTIPSSPTTLLGDAFAARPDLRAAELAVVSAVKRTGLAEAEAYKLTAALDTNGGDRGNSFEAGPGIDLPIPIFDRNQAGRTRARAALDKASAHYLAVRDQVILEVRESHARARQAQRSASTWHRDIIPPLESSVTEAEKAYKGGSVSFLQVVEINRKLTNARLRESEARADLQRAAIELDRAVGHQHN